LPVYGGDPFSYDFRAALDPPEQKKRDPWLSYGIPPALSRRFQATGKGPMFKPPHRIVPEGKTHPIVHVHSGHNGTTVPTWGVTRQQFELHRKFYGDEFIESVETVDKAPAKPPRVRRVKPNVRNFSRRPHKTRADDARYKDEGVKDD
jgi:hypothetical protein